MIPSTRPLQTVFGVTTVQQVDNILSTAVLVLSYPLLEEF